ncbi:MAG: DNA-binding protein [Alphaproteobacteria bacterium]|nr:DNA-binding protein [Alphaproteobacteria bacterium]
MDDETISQDDVFAFLADSATHGGNKVRRIDTHAASVFLAGERALKVKRAVRFPFLDYSTLDKRKAACEAELEVNRPFAPELYLRVVPIVRAGEGFAIGGEGEPVEWAVEMRRFDEDRTLDRLADRGEIDGALADALGRAAVAMHGRAPVVDAGPWLGAVEKFLGQNKEAFAEYPAQFPNARAEALDRASRAALERLRPLLAERGRRGLIRRGHGDLHLGNIALIEGKPLPFDAIEFDPLIAAGDVLYDLSFLLMDLVERGLRGPANAVFNRYLTEAVNDADLDGLAALPFFMSLRAAIRAKVTAARLHDAAPAQRSRIVEQAEAYFRLAGRVLAPPKPRLFAVGGLSGTGKSLLARALAPHVPPEPGAVVVRSDVERKRMFGTGETERLPAEAYRPEVGNRVYARVTERAGAVAKAGHSAIADAVYARADERSAIAGAAAGAGVAFTGLFLVAPLDVRLQRVGTRTGDASDADARVAREQEAYALDGLDWIRVDASGTPEETLKRALEAIGR